MQHGLIESTQHTHEHQGYDMLSVHLVHVVLCSLLETCSMYATAQSTTTHSSVSSIPLVELALRSVLSPMVSCYSLYVCGPTLPTSYLMVHHILGEGLKRSHLDVHVPAEIPLPRCHRYVV